MTSLNMDIDDADNALLRIRDGYGQMASELENIRAQIHDTLQLLHGWYSASANEFYEAFDNFDSAFCSKLNALNKLGDILELERDQWKDMAAHLHSVQNP